MPCNIVWKTFSKCDLNSKFLFAANSIFHFIRCRKKFFFYSVATCRREFYKGSSSSAEAVLSNTAGLPKWKTAGTMFLFRVMNGIVMNENVNKIGKLMAPFSGFFFLSFFGGVRFNLINFLYCDASTKESWISEWSVIK